MTLAAFVIASQADAQISTGTITVGDPISCSSIDDGSTWYSGMTCLGATISCSNVDSNVEDIGLYIGYVTQATTPKGTIVFFTGGTGSGSDLGPTNAFAADYVSNYMIVYVDWASAWEKSNSTASLRNTLSAACRPATLLNWANSSGTVHPSGAMCAQGKSAGSAAIAYSMSWYGAGSYLTNVELLAGPVLTEMNEGCTYSPAPPNVTMCNDQTWCESSYGSSGGWTTSAGYTSDKVTDITDWTPVSDCEESSITSAQLTTLTQMSIVGGVYGTVTPTYSFTTKRHGWVCAGPASNYYDGTTDCPGFSDDCPNNSSPQGWYWYDQATDSNMVLSGTNTCKGSGTGQTLYSSEAEGIEGGLDPIFTTTSETTEIEADMSANCQ